VQNLREAQRLEEIKKLENAQNMLKQRKEYYKDYLEYEQKKQNAKNLEKQDDKNWVSSITSQQQAEENKQFEKQKQMRDEIAAYLAYVDHLKQQEQEHETNLEELRQKELNKEWNKRELQWTKEELAREQLLQTVIQDRQDQISYNNLQKEKIKIEDCSDSIKLNKHVEALDIQEKEKDDQRWKYNKEIQQFFK